MLNRQSQGFGTGATAQATSAFLANSLPTRQIASIFGKSLGFLPGQTAHQLEFWAVTEKEGANKLPAVCTTTNKPVKNCSVPAHRPRVLQLDRKPLP